MRARFPIALALACLALAGHVGATQVRTESLESKSADAWRIEASLRLVSVRLPVGAGTLARYPVSGRCRSPTRARPPSGAPSSRRRPAATKPGWWTARSASGDVRDWLRGGPRMPRFNHMELTLPPGRLAEQRQEIRHFFHEIFGFDSIDVPIVGQNGLLLRTDPETSQFILVTEQEKSLSSPGYDHLGFPGGGGGGRHARRGGRACSIRCSSPSHDARVMIRVRVPKTGPVTVHAFYVKYLLPIWFDVQSRLGNDPAHNRWATRSERASGSPQSLRRPCSRASPAPPRAARRSRRHKPGGRQHRARARERTGSRANSRGGFGRLAAHARAWASRMIPACSSEHAVPERDDLCACSLARSARPALRRWGSPATA